MAHRSQYAFFLFFFVLMTNAVSGRFDNPRRGEIPHKFEKRMEYARMILYNLVSEDHF